MRVFAANLRDLLLAAPAGGRATMGLDPATAPASRSRWSDATGKAVATAVIHPHEPQRQERGARDLSKLASSTRSS